MESEEFGLVLGEKLLGLEALHYGYWDTQPKEEKNFTITEIIKAQERYSDFILAQIDRQLEKQFPKKFTSQVSQTIGSYFRCWLWYWNYFMRIAKKRLFCRRGNSFHSFAKKSRSQNQNSSPQKQTTNLFQQV